MSKKSRKLEQVTQAEVGKKPFCPTPPKEPTLLISPTAWQKIVCALQYTKTEVGFFGITDVENGLFVRDLYVPDQTVTAASTQFEASSIQEYVCQYAGSGYQPHQLTRVWIHTHPGDNTQPSGVDDATFKTNIGQSNIGFMVIVGKNLSASAWIQFSDVQNVAGQYRQPIKVDVCWHADTEAFDYQGFIELLEDRITEYKQPTYNWQGNLNKTGWGYRQQVKANEPAKEAGAIVLPNQFCEDNYCDMCDAKIGLYPRHCTTCGAQVSRCGACYAYVDMCLDCCKLQRIPNPAADKKADKKQDGPNLIQG